LESHPPLLSSPVLFSPVLSSPLLSSLSACWEHLCSITHSHHDALPSHRPRNNGANQPGTEMIQNKHFLLCFCWLFCHSGPWWVPSSHQV
jgi:hypothetical protein